MSHNSYLAGQQPEGPGLASRNHNDPATDNATTPAQTGERHDAPQNAESPLQEMKVLSKEEKKNYYDKRRGEEAEHNVWDILYTYGRKNKESMFVIAGYTHRNYLVNVVTEEKKKGGSRWSGEHDILVIHKDLGVILFEVKAYGDQVTVQSQKNKKRLRKCKEQLKTAEQEIKNRHPHLFTRKDQSLKVWKVITFPNLEKQHLHSTEMVRLTNKKKKKYSI